MEESNDVENMNSDEQEDLADNTETDDLLNKAPTETDDLLNKADHDLADREENDNFATGDDNFELLADTTNKSEHIELINKVRTFWFLMLTRMTTHIKAKLCNGRTNEY